MSFIMPKQILEPPMTTNTNNCKVDIFKFDIEQKNSEFNVTITDVISWNQMRIRATKQELELLVDFIHSFTRKEQIK
jgi:hypothetical protein